MSSLKAIIFEKMFQPHMHCGFLLHVIEVFRSPLAPQNVLFYVILWQVDSNGVAK